MRFVVPEVVRVSDVEGGSKAGFGRGWEGTKEPWMVKAEAMAEKNSGARTRSFMVVGVSLQNLEEGFDLKVELVNRGLGSG